MVARPGIRYLLEKTQHRVSVGDQTTNTALKYLAGHPRGQALEIEVKNQENLRGVISEHDLVISLLPPNCHPLVAESCLAEGKDLVTTSYVSAVMRSMDQEARKRGLILLNEIGVDPGIDHMSAMRIIHDAQRRGGRVASFASYCGGLPAPDSRNNPLGYKFSWRPEGVLGAMKSSARFLGEGVEIDVPADELFRDPLELFFEGIGDLEYYPNRDALPYADLYGIEDMGTIYRGTLRYPGWCAFWDKALALGLLDENPRHDLARMGYVDFLSSLVGSPVRRDLNQALAKRVKLEREGDDFGKFRAALRWLGFFSINRIPVHALVSVEERRRGSNFHVTADLLSRNSTLQYQYGERDMLVMRHEFEIAFRSSRQKVASTMIDFGINRGDSSMSRTVSLPAAIAADLIVSDRSRFSSLSGVRIPTDSIIYTPVLQKLEELGISMKETAEAV